MNEQLCKHIGRYFNEDTKSEIEKEFNNVYTITKCDLDRFYLEDFWENQIRCVVVDGKIYKLQFN